MAVVRITAPKRWHLRAAKAVGDQRRLRRELERAAERRGLQAELHGDEAALLVERLPGDERAIAALETLRESEAREAARPRARDIAMGRVGRA